MSDGTPRTAEMIIEELGISKKMWGRIRKLCPELSSDDNKDIANRLYFLEEDAE